MKNYNYKAVIFGKGLYQEIALQGDYENGVVLGTTGRSRIRFDQNRFFEDFEVELFCDTDKWRISCSNNIYIESDSALKLYSKELNHGDEVEIRYESSKSPLFKISFTIDFDEVCSDYNMVYDISTVSIVEIGGTDYCTIKINDELVGDDYILLTRQGKEFVVDDSHTKYGIYINGFKNKENIAVIQDYDFFMLDGISFYLKDNRLYTDSKKNNMQSKLKCCYVTEQNNVMEYPQFRKNVRIHKVVPDKTIKILPPEPKPEKKDENFAMTLLPTLISFVAMIVLRSMMRGNKMFVVYCAITMGIGIVTSVISYFRGKKQYRENVESRKKEYTEYLKKKEIEIVNIRKQEKEILEDIYIDVNTEMAQIRTFDKRLFERDISDNDYLVVRLGSGKVKARCNIEITEKECIKSGDPLSELPEILSGEYEYISDAPVVMDLKACNGVGIVGSQDAQYNMLKLITVDMAARQYFEDVKFYYIFDETYENIFSNLRWLQNIYLSDAPVRNMVYEEEGKKVILEYLYSELSRREGMNKDALKDMKNHVVFVYSSDAFFVHPISQYLRQAKELKFTFIFFDEHREFIPQYVDKLIILDAENSGELIDAQNSDIRQKFVFDILDDEDLKRAVLRLGCVQIQSVNLESKLTKSISLFKLLNIMSVSDLDIGGRWNASKIYESMAAPLGVMANGNILYLDLHEKKHGPHGLVAGTTGSGKSEILQTYILSMASLYHPYDVGFVIIDFKGGGMVNQFKDLPHLIGSITNIDGREIERSLLSIKAELKKRQTIFADARVNHIDAYIKLFKKGDVKVPLPHLILIVDEFAELKREQPDFMKELVSAARIGRSLGVHLILATQKPSGVVDDQIWSNSKFRLCLKVQNKNDSNEVLKSPVAAEIKEPGRAYLQVGNNELFELFQSAYSGLGVDEEHTGKEKEYKIYEINLAGMRKTVFEQKKRKNEEADTQLDALVNYINSYCEANGIERLPGICMPSLESHICYDDKCYDFEGSVGVALGIYDDPSQQLQETVLLNITHNHTFIVGSAQYGKTNILQLIIKQLAMNYSPEDVNIYMMDFASKSLMGFDNLAHVGGVILISDEEKLENFFRMMSDEMQQRKDKLASIGISSYSAYREAGYTDMSQIVILIDNFNALREMFLSKEDRLLPICREGLSVGISITCTDIQTSGVGYKYMSTFSQKIALFCNNDSEYSSLFGSCRIKNRNIQGRGITEIDKKLYEFQAYLAFEGEKEIDRVNAIKEFIKKTNDLYPDSRAKRIPEIPELFSSAYARANYPKLLNMPYQVLYGINYRNATPELLDMRKIPAMGIVGRSGMGSHNIVRVILDSLENNCEVAPVDIYIIDDYSKRFITYSNHKCVRRYTCNSEEAEIVLDEIEAYASQLKADMADNPDILDMAPLKLIVLQNKDAVEVLQGNKKSIESFKNITGKYKEFKICFLISDVDNAPVPFSGADIYKYLKDSRSYIILEDLKNFRIFDMPVPVKKAFEKNINTGEGFYCGSGTVKKLKLLKAED